MNAHATAERLQDLAEERAQAAAEMAERIELDLITHGEAAYSDQFGEIQTVDFDQLYEFCEPAIGKFFKSHFKAQITNSISKNTYALLLDSFVKARAGELAVSISKEVFYS